MPTNLSRLKHAYQAWHDTKGGSIDVWGELMADSFEFRSPKPDHESLAFSRATYSREDAKKRLAAIFDEWTMEHFSPNTWVDGGDTIAMFGTCGYRNRKTGKVAECLIASMWVFEGDRAVATTEVFDSAVAVAAATPDDPNRPKD